MNRSEADFDVQEGQVLYALGAVKSVGPGGHEGTVEQRRVGGPFRDLFDFAERVEPKLVGKRSLETLAKAGAFDSLQPNARGGARRSREPLRLRPGQCGGAHLVAGQLVRRAGRRRRAPAPASDRTALGQAEQLDNELAAVGFYLTGHPLRPWPRC
jgi:DNA polymerase-3 subunit alpha